MLRRIGVAISVGLADSINPSTVGPALFMATAPKPASRVLQFTAGIFGVNLLAGLVLTIGPGRLLLDLAPHPRGTAKHVIELVAGVMLLLVAGGLLLGRRSLARRELPAGRGGKSALIAGASIAAVELPTAAAYFAVIGSIVASTANIPEQVLLLVLYNLAFVLPQLAIIALLLFAGPRAEPLLQRGGAWVQRRWPLALAILLLLVGSALTLLGGAGLVRE
jgi:cytochrome c biogenesis protein CcdA